MKAEIAPWEPTPDAKLAGAIAALCVGSRSRQPWVIGGGALKLLGYLPGDIVIVDTARTAQPDDIVLARRRLLPAAGQMVALMVLRKFVPPFLISASADPAYMRPIDVMGGDVTIEGVVAEMVRWLLPAPVRCDDIDGAGAGR